jgi:hypothetical protein
MALSSFASGALITTQGWTWLNLGSLLPIGAGAGVAPCGGGRGRRWSWLVGGQRQAEAGAVGRPVDGGHDRLVAADQPLQPGVDFPHPLPPRVHAHIGTGRGHAAQVAARAEGAARTRQHEGANGRVVHQPRHGVGQRRLQRLGQGVAGLRLVERQAGHTVRQVDRQCAHWTTFRLFKDVGMSQRRVVHGGGRSALATNRPTAAVGNPCSPRWSWPTSFLNRRTRCADASIRLPCPRGDCPARWPLDGPHETRSPRGAGRPRRATGCSAKVSSQERRSVSDPPGLPTRQVIPQLAGVCP